jgi:hypothetical protein
MLKQREEQLRVAALRLLPEELRLEARDMSIEEIVALRNEYQRAQCEQGHNQLDILG